MATNEVELGRARAAYAARAWGDALAAFRRADDGTALELDDLERLAWSAALTGDDDGFLGALERLYRACLDAGEPARAARAAFWLGFRLSSIGDGSRATGWLARSGRLVERAGEPCAERGYLLLPTVFRHLGAADNAAAEEVANEAARIGERCRDGDLVALARHLEGRALMRQGRTEEGLALLDEVMLAVTAGELSPIVTGIVYCNVLLVCQQMYALDRARQWTAALASWCDENAQLVTFTGHCLVHRAELLQLGGAWEDALEEVRQICERLETFGDPDAFGDACYQRAELHRLRGEFEDAERAYRAASDKGRDPQPGLALLRVRQGEHEAGIASLRRALSTTPVEWARARLLPAFVEIAVACGALDEARAASRELDAIAKHFGTEILGAIADHARGTISVADANHRDAIEPLRNAFAVWNRVGAPYIAARIRATLSRAYLGLGDRDGADLERAAARKVFEEFGAAPDLVALDPSAAPTTAVAPAPSWRPATAPARAHRLSPRELEVLRLIATGKTNKAIGRQLFVSERTIDRHVSNIFTKIGVASRAAATAYAYDNALV